MRDKWSPRFLMDNSNTMRKSSSFAKKMTRLGFSLSLAITFGAVIEHFTSPSTSVLLSNEQMVRGTATAVAKESGGDLQRWLEEQGASPEVWNRATHIVTTSSITLADGEEKYIESGGSGWILRTKGNYLYLITAGHVLYNSKVDILSIFPGSITSQVRLTLEQPQKDFLLSFNQAQYSFTTTSQKEMMYPDTTIVVMKIPISTEQKESLGITNNPTEYLREGYVNSSEIVFSLTYPNSTDTLPYAEVGALEGEQWSTQSMYKSKNIAASDGSSGGVISDSSGRVVGITQSAFSGATYFVPVEKRVIEELIKELDE